MKSINGLRYRYIAFFVYRNQMGEFRNNLKRIVLFDMAMFLANSGIPVPANNFLKMKLANEKGFNKYHWPLKYSALENRKTVGGQAAMGSSNEATPHKEQDAVMTESESFEDYEGAGTDDL